MKCIAMVRRESGGKEMLTAWMSKDSDFIHSYVPGVPLQGNRFKYDLKCIGDNKLIK